MVFVRFVIQVQHIFQAGNNGGAHLGDAPLLFLPGLEFVFLSVRRTLSYDMESANPNSTALSASKRNVQRAWPSGGLLHATAMRWASSLPLSLHRGPGRDCSLSALSNPSSTNRLRGRHTVAMPTSKAAAICRSNNPSSAFLRIRARVTLLAGAFPRRVTWRRCSRSSSLRSTRYLDAPIPLTQTLRISPYIILFLNKSKITWLSTSSTAPPPSAAALGGSAGIHHMAHQGQEMEHHSVANKTYTLTSRLCGHEVEVRQYSS